MRAGTRVKSNHRIGVDIFESECEKHHLRGKLEEAGVPAMQLLFELTVSSIVEFRCESPSSALNLEIRIQE